jgi:hypothetical protein
MAESFGARPRFDDLPLVIEPKDINPRPVAIPRPCWCSAHNEVIVGQDSPEFDAFAGVLASHTFEVFDERGLSLGDDRVVLRVAGADVSPNSFGRLALIEHQIVEGVDG